MKRLTETIPALAFLLVVGCLCLATWFYDPPQISYSERRVLAAMPDFSLGSVAGGKFMAGFEEYALDSFWARDSFRKLKARAVFSLFGQRDNNGIYVVDGCVAKIEEVEEADIVKTAQKLTRLLPLLPDSANIYYSIVPDKGHYLAAANGYPGVDYQLVERLLAEAWPDLTYIDLKPALSADKYYATDLHWDQGQIFGVANTLGQAMDFPQLAPADFTRHELSPFYGVYYGQSALPLPAESLTYLRSEIIDGAKVQLLDAKTAQMVDAQMYYEQRFDGIDPYELFLAGAQPLITISNPRSETERELYVFRDSFSSSLAPLLSHGYAKVTLIDLRYLASPLLAELVSFSSDADVLFLYGVQILANSDILLIQ